jgi:hypothetical protein
MTETDWDTLEAYILNMAERLHLRDWEIDFSRDDTDGDKTLASASLQYEAKRVTIQVSAGFRESLNAYEQRETIIHELLHCHLWSANCVVARDLWNTRALSESTHRLLQESFQRQEELAINAISAAIAQHYPLIDWEGRAD